MRRFDFGSVVRHVKIVERVSNWGGRSVSKIISVFPGSERGQPDSIKSRHRIEFRLQEAVSAAHR